MYLIWDIREQVGLVRRCLGCLGCICWWMGVRLGEKRNKDGRKPAFIAAVLGTLTEKLLKEASLARLAIFESAGTEQQARVCTCLRCFSPDIDGKGITLKVDAEPVRTSTTRQERGPASLSWPLHQLSGSDLNSLHSTPPLAYHVRRGTSCPSISGPLHRHLHSVTNIVFHRSLTQSVT